MARNTERIDKILANNGFGSRRDVKKLLRTGIVLLNGAVCTDCEARVNLETDTLSVDGEQVAAPRNVYLMMNKPAGVVSSTKDGRLRTVLDILPPAYVGRGLFPAGRLDLDTEGLLILTDDGEFTHRIISPKSNIGKTYYARLDVPVAASAVALFKDGVTLDDEYRCLPAELVLLTPVTAPESSLEALLTIHEGKFHQVKRMFASVGSEVQYLKRLSVGALRLDESLPLGGVRELTREELVLTGAWKE